MTTKEELVEAIKTMSVLDLSELVKELEDVFGVSAAAPVAVATAAPTDGADAAPPPEEEKTEFNVMLNDFGANKINVIKVVRSVTTLGLKEAKELVESAPTVVKEAIAKGEAEDVKAKLEEAGAVVVIQ